MKKKIDQLQTSIDIVSTMEMCGKDEMLQELSKRGFHLTQATLSRNLKELGIAKITNNDGRYHYAKHIKEAPVRIQNNHNFAFIGYKSVDYSDRLVVIKTNPGYASMIAGEIDSNFDELILGSIAGGDTIFVVLKDNVEQNDFQDKLDFLIPRI